jgi:methionine aminotransferase
LIQVSKLPESGTTIFTVMSKMAQDHGAVNLSQGFPDFDGPPALVEAVARHVAQGHNQYAPLAGVPALLEQISCKVADLYGHAADAGTMITVTPGATEAIFAAVTACVHPGDEVVLFDPSYDTYAPCVRLNGGVPRHLSLSYPEFRIDWDRVRSMVSDRTRLIMINSPHNPTGSVLGEGDMTVLKRLMDDHPNLLLLSDEVYEHITFDGRPHRSVLREPELAERAFCISSFGKTYHVTGWRIGYCIAPPALTAEFLKIHQFIAFATNAPLQHALADFLRDCPEHHRELGVFYQAKRDLFCKLMADSAFRLSPSAGTYFQLADYSAISDEPDTEFAARLTREHGVAAIPISVFYEQPPDQRLVRFCFAKHDQTLEQAAGRLSALRRS